MLKEFHRVDLTTGERLDVLLFDVDINEIPEDCKLGWVDVFHNPKWSFELDTWVEGYAVSEIIEPLRLAKVDQLNAECQVAITSGFEHDGDFFQFNDKDQANFSQQLTLLLVDPTLIEIVWRTENNGVKVYTREQFIDTCKAGEVHKRNNIGHYWQLKEYVMTYDFTTVEELNNINFNFVIGTGIGV